MLFDALIEIPKYIIDLMPPITVQFPDGVFETMNQMLLTLAYLFPINGLMPILVISFTLSMTKAVWAIILRVKSFIPTMGA